MTKKDKLYNELSEKVLLICKIWDFDIHFMNDLIEIIKLVIKIESEDKK